MTIHNVTNALGRYITHKAEVYEQTDTDISQPKKTYLVMLLIVMLGLVVFDAFLNNKYIAFAFELLVFTTFIVVLGILMFVVFPAIHN